MKKITSMLLILVMLLGVFTLTSCKAGALKFGLGVYSTVSSTDATEDKVGEGKATVTIAAVLLNKRGEIVKAAVDCAESTVQYDMDGKAHKPTEFRTKYEQGAGYGMVAMGGAKNEWFEQANAFCEAAVGKTADELKALVATDGKGTEEVINAGCTIVVSEFVKALEAAIENATESEATKDAKLEIGVSTTATPVDATDDRDGSSKVESSIFAAALDKDGAVIAAAVDCVEQSFSFDKSGKSTTKAKGEILSKGQMGDDYGMAKEPDDFEWYEQANAFCQVCLGKTATQISGLVGAGGKGNADVQGAGCTIVVTGFVKAAVKIA